MPFPEHIKIKAKQTAHYRCVICHDPFVQVHHIRPQEDDGPDTLDNAAPLCARCHDLFGGNPEKRKQIREMRDAWWELCEVSSVDPAFVDFYEHLDQLYAQVGTGRIVPPDFLNEVRGVISQHYARVSQAVRDAKTVQDVIRATAYAPSEHLECSRCEVETVPIGPRVHPQLGLVMWYRCPQCGAQHPGFEELEG